MGARKYQDPVEHRMYRAYLIAKAGAHFRGEAWQLTAEEWFAVWRPHWSKRGRGRDSWCITRIQESEAWCPDNVEIWPRHRIRVRGAQRRRERGLA